MNPLKHVLVATDLSPHARNAAERAAYLSKAQQASLDLLYVANPAPFERLKQLVAPDDDLLKRVLASAAEKTRALAALLFQRYDISAGVQVASGSVITEINRVVQDKRSDLLVCGAKGQSVARRLLLGSTVQKMLNHMPCPLLVVKPAPRDAYRTVLVPVDFSPVSLRAIKLAKAIAPQAEIILLHV
ncbi:MAG: universal stress protein, partial [Pseudomonas putida]